MTTYILAGGGDRVYSEYLNQLVRVIEAKVTRPKILSCWFSNSDETANAQFTEYRDYFLASFEDGTTFIRAERGRFIEQVRDVDVIYLHGGHTDLLLAAMQEYEGMEGAFTGKIIVGSSAGANYLSRVGFSPSKEGVVEGSGILDVATVVHYGSRGFGGKAFEPAFWDEATRKVREASGKDEVILLPEGTFTVIER